MPTVKYVGMVIAILPARISETASSSSAKRLPSTIAKEKLFFVCKFASFENADES